MAYGVYNYLDVSTAHIPEHLLNGECELKLANYPQGAFFYVPDPDPACESEPIPPEIEAVFKYAAEHNCIIVRFDADGMLFPEFPEYDWD